MSLYDKASLVQIPSGTKSGLPNGKLYSVLPANGNGDFTHTRASSATRVNKDGLIESVAFGVPRLDYPLIDGVVQSCPALLLEPSRTNSFQRSEELDNAYWTKATGISVTANQAVSPDGNTTAEKVILDSGTNNINGGLYRSISTSAATKYALSFFAKKGEYRYGTIGFGSNASNGFHFDLEDGVILSEFTDASKYTNISKQMIDYGNGWYRLIVVTQEDVGGGRFLGIRPHNEYPTSSNNNYSSTGDGTSGIYVWGAQLEVANDYATSYIPTTTATVTRSADVCNGAGTSAEFNDSEGVLFAEISALSNDGTNRRISINDNVADDDRVLIGFSSTDNQIQGQSRTGTSTQAALDHTVPDATIPNKVAMKYKANDFALWINGFEVDTDGGGTAPAGLIRLSFDRTAGANDFYGNTKQLMTFNQALTDSELEQITSWTSFSEMAKGQLYTIE